MAAVIKGRRRLLWWLGLAGMMLGAMVLGLSVYFVLNPPVFYK
jgi:hypothetical protein